MAHCLAPLLVEQKNNRHKATKEYPVLKRLINATNIAVNFLATTLEGNRSENPSLRKIGIAMAGASPLVFQLTVGTLEGPKERVVFIPAYWTFMVSTDRSLMLLAGTSPNDPTRWYKIHYNTATGLAYYDAGSINLAA